MKFAIVSSLVLAFASADTLRSLADGDDLLYAETRTEDSSNDEDR